LHPRPPRPPRPPRHPRHPRFPFLPASFLLHPSLVSHVVRLVPAQRSGPPPGGGGSRSYSRSNTISVCHGFPPLASVPALRLKFRTTGTKERCP
jgi:hypothetical protein